MRSPAWDVWGAQPVRDAKLSADELAFFDEIALLTTDPDVNFDALRRRFADDASVRLPETVFNALRQREERVSKAESISVRRREQVTKRMQGPVEKAIRFIESHFSRDITLDEFAGVCGLSRFQMSRLFSHTMGTTVTTYRRGRRLTEAARPLADGVPDILAVALQTGYGSHEAFSRAFRDQFGLTPAEVRAAGSSA